METLKLTPEELNTLFESNEVKWVKGYEGKYCADKKGHIFIILKSVIRSVKFHPINSGYLIVSLTTKDGIKSSKLAGPIILSAWVPKPKPEYVLSYKDKNKYNLNLDNLEWQTLKYVHHKKRVPIDLWKDNQVLHFDNITTARVFLHLSNAAAIKKARGTEQLVKGYKVLEIK